MSASTVHTAVEPARCYLLKLSPELRNIIYTMVLKTNHSIKIDSRYQDDEDWNIEKAYQLFHITYPSLLQVSQQIRAEATSLFFSINTFSLPLDLDYAVLGTHDLSVDFGPLGEHLRWMRRFELEYASVRYIVDISRAPKEKSVRFDHLAKPPCVRCKGSMNGFCKRVCEKRCREVEKILERAFERRGAKVCLELEDFVQIFRAIL